MTQRNASAIFTGAFGGFCWYFGEIGVDPTNPDRVYAMGVSLLRSDDGGVSWTDYTGLMHGTSTRWIDPTNANRIYAGNDGGFYYTNAGPPFTPSDDLPITQFYAGEVDPTDATRVFGGAQDNGTNMTSTGDPYGWFNILGGDGFFVAVDPATPSVVFTEWRTAPTRAASSARRPAGRAARRRAAGPGATVSRSTPIVFNPRSQHAARGQPVRVPGAQQRPELDQDQPRPLERSRERGRVRLHHHARRGEARHERLLRRNGTTRVWRTTNRGTAWTDISAGLPKLGDARGGRSGERQVVYVTLSGTRPTIERPDLSLDRPWNDVDEHLGQPAERARERPRRGPDGHEPALPGDRPRGVGDEKSREHLVRGGDGPAAHERRRSRPARLVGKLFASRTAVRRGR